LEPPDRDSFITLLAASAAAKKVTFSRHFFNKIISISGTETENDAIQTMIESYIQGKGEKEIK